MSLCNAKQAAEYFQVSEQTIWRWGRTGKLKKRQFGRTVRYYLEERNGCACEGTRKECKTNVD